MWYVRRTLCGCYRIQDPVWLLLIYNRVTPHAPTGMLSRSLVRRSSWVYDQMLMQPLQASL